MCTLHPRGPHESTSQTASLISISSAAFAQLTAESPYALQSRATHFPPQNYSFTRGIWIPSNTWFLGPMGVHNPNSASIGSAVFAGLTTVTDRQTHRPCYSVCNNRPHLRNTAMWHNNAKIGEEYIGLQNNNIAYRVR